MDHMQWPYEGPSQLRPTTNNERRTPRMVRVTKSPENAATQTKDGRPKKTDAYKRVPRRANRRKLVVISQEPVHSDDDEYTDCSSDDSLTKESSVPKSRFKSVAPKNKSPRCAEDINDPGYWDFLDAYKEMAWDNYVNKGRFPTDYDKDWGTAKTELRLYKEYKSGKQLWEYWPDESSVGECNPKPEEPIDENLAGLFLEEINENLSNGQGKSNEDVVAATKLTKVCSVGKDLELNEDEEEEGEIFMDCIDCE